MSSGSLGVGVAVVCGFWARRRAGEEPTLTGDIDGFFSSLSIGVRDRETLSKGVWDLEIHSEGVLLLPAVLLSGAVTANAGGG